MKQQAGEKLAVASPTGEAKKNSSRKLLGAFVIVMLLVVLLSAAGTVYVWRQLQASQLQARAYQEGVHKRLLGINSTLDQRLAALFGAQQHLADLVKRNQSTPQAHTLVEVDNWVRLAAFHLTFENNIILARRLLDAADRRLAAEQNAIWWPLRQAFAQDIALLAAAESVDLPGLMASMSALSQQAEQLPQIPLELLSNPSIAVPKALDEGSGISSIWGKCKQFAVSVGHTLAGMVIVSKDNQAVPALLTAEQRTYLVTNIQSQLLLAQWAAVQRQTVVYQQSLAQVDDWLIRYFAAHIPLIQSMRKTLVGLKSIAVNPPTPEISHSLAALEKIKI